jgi:GT2 family glycosyltransferase
MKNNISLLIGLKNNLDYNKHFYQTTRELYPTVEICFSSYNSTDGTHEWLDEIKQSDLNVKCWWSDSIGTFSDNFNKAAELATNDYVMYLHNDIVLAPGFIENIEKHLNPNKVVSYTTIEPPIFAGHERPGKIIKDFGTSLESFNQLDLFKFIADKQQEYNNQTETGITFFMCIPRQILLDIGGMDNLYNPMFCEDDDLIKRFRLLGLELITSLDAICYHFVSKTSRFSDEYQSKTQQIENNSNKNFIRKWGSRNSDVKYNIAFIPKYSTNQVLEVLEPWCDRIYLDNDMDVIILNYIKNEQPNTKFDLTKRIYTAANNDPLLENDIIIEFDTRQLNQQSFDMIQKLPEIIKESGDLGEFELDIFKITINSMIEYQNDLIYLKNN